MERKILDEFLDEIRARGASTVAKASGIPKRTIETWLYCNVVPPLTKAAQVLDSMGLELLIFDKMD